MNRMRGEPARSSSAYCSVWPATVSVFNSGRGGSGNSCFISPAGYGGPRQAPSSGRLAASAIASDPERRARVRHACSFAIIKLFRSEEHTSELQSLMRISYAVFCLKKKKKTRITKRTKHNRPETRENLGRTVKIKQNKVKCTHK